MARNDDHPPARAGEPYEVTRTATGFIKLSRNVNRWREHTSTHECFLVLDDADALAVADALVDEVERS